MDKEEEVPYKIKKLIKRFSNHTLGRQRTGSRRRELLNGNPLFESQPITRENYGVDQEEFDLLLRRVKGILDGPLVPGTIPRKKKLSAYYRLKMGIYWLRNANLQREFMLLSGVNKSYISRNNKIISIALFCVLDEIRMPHNPYNGAPTAFDCFGFLDCTNHIRNRENPGQNWLFRADKHCHSLTVQCISDFRGIPIRIDIGLGHQNDSGMLNMSGLSNFLIDNNYHVLGDEGYTHSNILSPFRNPTTEQEREFNQLHYGIRATVETVFSQVKWWQIASRKFRQSVSIHKIVLFVVYQLAAMYLKQHPLRGISWYVNRMDEIQIFD